MIDLLNKWDATTIHFGFSEGTTSSFGKLDPFKMGVFKAAENGGHMIQPLVFCYDNPMVDWGSSRLKKIFSVAAIST